MWGIVESDEFGPEKMLGVYDSRTGMKGMVIIDNTSLGPGKGGIRMTPTVNAEEIAKLARTMTWKNSIAGLPFGGAKSGIIADPKRMNLDTKRGLVEAFARALKIVTPELYIAAPDMNMGEQEMGWFVKASGSMKAATGKPRSMGGLPHELGSTGYGVSLAAAIAARHAGLDPEGMTVAVEGFGNVGQFAAKYLSEAGATIVAASDSKGIIYNARGLDVARLIDMKKTGGSVVGYRPGRADCCESILDVRADMLVTAAIPDLVGPGDVERLEFSVIVEGSNIPIAPMVEEMVHRRGILVIPDIVANSGGVISSYVEFAGGSEKEMFAMVKKKIEKNTEDVLDGCSSGQPRPPRSCALEMAMQKVREGIQGGGNDAHRVRDKRGSA